MFPCCTTREDPSIDVSITNVGLILTKLWWFGPGKKISFELHQISNVITIIHEKVFFPTTKVI